MYRIFFVLCSLLISISVYGQDVMMQGWYWDYPKTANGHNFTDTLETRISELSDAGITQLWLPPFSRASFGSNSNGYDPKDLYDLGEYGQGPTGFGTRSKVDGLISKLNIAGIEAVADVVYNHRDGGQAENNGAVEGWIENMDCTKVDGGDQPFPSDRVRFVLPIGAATGNGAGTYYIKVASASKHPNFYGKGYKFYVQTNVKGYQGLAPLNENEGSGNGGGDCGQGNEVVPLGVDMVATVDNVGFCGGTCGVDEFAVTVGSADYNPAGDSLFIYMNNTGGYSDHYIYGIWNGSADVQADLLYQTYTDFSSMPSGQGEMNYLNFKPNGNPTNLSGDWDAMLFFYDYDQNQADTRQKLIDWTQWLWGDVGIRGLRMDAVKHFDPAFVGVLMDSLHDMGQDHEMVVGEFFDTNAGALKNWVDQVELNMSPGAKGAINVRIFDFALRAALESASDQFGYDVRDIFDTGIVDGASGSAENVVTFVNNHDYRDEFQAIDNDPLLAYAYLLTNREVGQPTVFYPDFFGVQLPHGPSDQLGNDISKLNEIYNKYIVGGNIDYLNNLGTPATINYNSGFASTSLIYHSYNGGSSNNDAVVVINYAGDTLDVDFPLSSNSTKPTGTTFKDFTGKALSFEVVSNGSNRLRVVVPPRSYGIYVDADTDVNCKGDSIIYVDRLASGLNNGSSWKDAFENLASAISYCNLCPNVHEVWIKEGVHKPDVLDSRECSFSISQKLKVIGGFPNAIANPNKDDIDALAYPTILSGDIGVNASDLDNSYHIMQSNSSDTVWLSGLILENGNANGTSVFDKNAGGILVEGFLMLEDIEIRNCYAQTSGSAIHLQTAAQVSMINCKITSNTGIEDITLENGASLTIDGVQVTH